MSDQHEQDTWDQDEVEIADLGAPDRGLGRYLFALGEHWRAAAPFRARLITLLAALCLLIAILQAGSSSVNNRSSGAPHSAPENPLPSTIYLIDCGTTVNVNSLPGQVYVWEQVVSTPVAQECDFFRHPGSQCPTPQQLMPSATNKGVAVLCSDGTPLPGSVGKNGRKR